MVEAEPRPAYPTAPAAAAATSSFVRNPVHEQPLPRKQDQAFQRYSFERGGQKKIRTVAAQTR
eukprot:2291200-Alexandrium_andersonii.AAC.1